MDLEDRFDSDYEPDGLSDPRVTCRGELMAYKDKYVYWPSQHHHLTLFVKPNEQVEITALRGLNDEFIPDDVLHPMYVEENGDLDAVAAALDAEYRDPAVDFDNVEDISIDQEALGSMFEDLQWDLDRNITIYTWGRKHRRNHPGEASQDFNAGIISNHRHGPDIRIFTGLHSETQQAIQAARGYSCFMKNMIKKIEEDNLTVISIGSVRGKHRSVACAELLRRHFYPDAVIHHLHVKF